MSPSPLTKPRAPIEPKAVSGVGLLLAMLLLLAMALVLVLLAGPFGRTPTIREQPGPYTQGAAR